jgi:hypothetical protein
MGEELFMPLLSGTDAVKRIEQARNIIIRQLAERDAQFPEFGPVFPWTLVNRAQSYVFDLPAEALRRVRLHADAMNGTLGSYEYLHYPTLNGEIFCRDTGYLFLGEDVPVDMWAREYDLPGMEELKFGVQYKGLTVGSLTGPRQQNICNLYRLMKASPKPEQRLVFVEIGAGYGSFALDARRVLPDCTYVIVDLPETILYSASYLSAHRPDLRAYVYAPGDDITTVLKNVEEYDLAFIPNYRASAIEALPYIDIGFNAISFPEMAQETVEQYLGLIAPKLRRFFISVNYRQPADIRHAGIDNLLSKRFQLFPTPHDYRSQLKISDTAYDDHNFRPTFIGVTEACLPLGDVELRCVSTTFGHVKIRNLAGHAVLSKDRIENNDKGPAAVLRKLLRKVAG